MLEIVLHEAVVEDEGEGVDNQGGVVHYLQHRRVPVYPGRVGDGPPLEFEHPLPLDVVVDNKDDEGQDLAEGKPDEEDGEEDEDGHLAFNSVLKFLLVLLALHVEQ